MKSLLAYWGVFITGAISGVFVGYLVCEDKYKKLEKKEEA